jgi:hypothetical protein
MAVFDSLSERSPASKILLLLKIRDASARPCRRGRCGIGIDVRAVTLPWWIVIADEGSRGSLASGRYVDCRPRVSHAGGGARLVSRVSLPTTLSFVKSLLADERQLGPEIFF